MVKFFSKNLLKIFLLSVLISLVTFVTIYFSNFIFQQKVQVNPQDILSNEVALKSFLKNHGPRETIATIASLAPQAGVDCHQLVHKAGRLASEIFDIEKAFREGTGDCHSGYYHGTTEGYFAKFGTKNLSQNLSKLCTVNLNSFFRHQCFHGVGHGLMAWTNYEIFEALSNCDLLENSSSCATGVFMENFVGAFPQGSQNPSGHTSKYLSDDPHYPCNIVPDKYKYQCYFLQTSRMVQIFGGDFEKVVKSCLEAPKDYHSACFQSMGRDVGGFTRGNPQASINKCQAAPKGSNRTDCLSGAVQDYFWTPEGANLAIDFCKALEDFSEKTVCYNTIIGRARDVLAKEDWGKFCSQLEVNFQSNCRTILTI